MAWRNVRRNWRHSVAAIMAIAVGFVAIGLFDGFLGYVIHQHSDELGHRYMYGDVLVEREGADGLAAKENPLELAMDARDQQFLEDFLSRRSSQVVARARFLHLSGFANTGSSNAMFFGFGYDVAEGAVLRGPWRWNVVAGKPLEASGPESALVGRGMGAKLDCASLKEGLALDAAGKALERAQAFKCGRTRLQLTATTEKGQLNVVEPEIVGISAVPLREIDERLIMMPLRVAQQLLDTSKVTLYSIKVANGVDATEFARTLVSEARTRGLALRAMPWREHSTAVMLKQGIDLLGMYRTLVALVVFAIAGMSVVATMMRAVAERTREIGTLRSLGFRRSHVRMLFQIEGGLLALVAACVGLVATVVLALVINAAKARFRAGLYTEPLLLVINIDLRAYLWAASFLVGMAQLAVFFPARRAARLAIPDALGHA